MANGAFEWKFGMSKYVFPKQNCRDFVTKFIVCLPILSQCPLYADSFQGFIWFLLGNSELSKTSNHFRFPKRFSEILLGFVQCCFISGVSIDSDYRLLKWQNHSWFFKWFSDMLSGFLRFSVILADFIFRRS